MGQAQSAEVAVAADYQSETPEAAAGSGSRSASAPTSMEAMIAEAAAYGNYENESLEAKAQRALECPCVSELRNGPCGVQFSEAFLCFFKSEAEAKGSDCVNPFVALQNCIKANPDAFSKDILEENEEQEKEAKAKEVERTQEYRIVPPAWSREAPSPKSKI